MIKAKGKSTILDKAAQAMRRAIKNVIQERKLRKQPLIVWRDGKVVKLPVSRLKRF